MGARLGNINLLVQDAERSRDFYTNALGLTVKEQAPPSFVLLQAGECTITLQTASAIGETTGTGTEGVELGFAVENVNATRERLAEAGAEVGAVQQMGWGQGVDARDPDGHCLTIYRMADSESEER